MDKKVELFKNTKAISAKLERLPEVCKTMQKLFNKLNSNGLKASFEVVKEAAETHIFASRQTNGQNQSIYDGHKEWSHLIKSLAIDSNPENSKVMGFKMNREKLIDLMEIDEVDTKALIDLIRSLTYDDWSLLKFLEFDNKTATVKVMSSHTMEIEESHTIYADNERQIKVTAALLALIEALNNYLDSCELFSRLETIDGLKLDSNKAYQLDIERIKRL